MKVKYVSKQLREATITTIQQANEIIEDYAAQGYRMTLRQLYYQFVSKNLIPNVEKSYKKLASVVSDGRLCGLIDWDGIEDRGRSPSVPFHYASTGQILESFKYAAAEYKLDRWGNQENYVELWVEKQALASVLEPLASQHHVTLMVNKGYSSQSAMRDSALRIKEALFSTVKQHEYATILYLGDHDPSGEDMVRDIRARMRMFQVDVNVVKIALTSDQIDQYRPPPNPAKLSDPRASAYVAEHGDSSWEVDALPPNILSGIVTKAILELLDAKALEKVKKQEQHDRESLHLALEDIESNMS